MKNNEIFLKNMIRKTTPEDFERLPVSSYSKMEVFKNCPRQFDYKYNQELQVEETSLALELGSLCHYVLEQKGKQIKENGQPDYDILNNILDNGVNVFDEKTREVIPGVKELSKKYFEEWYAPDNASGMTYNQKMGIYDQVLLSEMMDEEEWEPLLFEYPFEFVYDERIIFHGFIDRIDQHKITGDLRTIDYKTSKKVYTGSKLATSMQFGIYALAMLNEFDRLPIDSIYRFILLNETQHALTLGWEKRFVKSINKLLDSIDQYSESGRWVPKPTPLCYWCSYCENNPSATTYSKKCQYYSLWTPKNKTFEKKNDFDSLQNEDTTVKLYTKDRKLIF